MNEQSIGDYLSRHPFFSGMDDKHIEFLAASAVQTQIGEGGILFNVDGVRRRLGSAR